MDDYFLWRGEESPNSKSCYILSAADKIESCYYNIPDSPCIVPI